MNEHSSPIQQTPKTRDILKESKLFLDKLHQTTPPHNLNGTNIHNNSEMRPSDESISKIFDAVSNPDAMNPQGQDAADGRCGLFIMRTANDCNRLAHSKPIPQKLFGELWYEGELCIMFATTNVGKSILAVQIADSISSGHAGLSPLEMNAPSQKIVYVDFELSDKQFEKRTSRDYKDHHQFSDYFIRVSLDSDSVMLSDPNVTSSEDYEAALYKSLEDCIKRSGAKIIIVDNITWMKGSTETAKDALPLMKYLKSLKSRYGLSVLALAHTPKRDATRPLSLNDLQGSSMLMNFCDSCFAIGLSADRSVRYIKQIKTREGELLYGTDSVIMCELSNPDNLVRFTFVNFGFETDLLKEASRDTRDEEIMRLHKEGHNALDIARMLGVGKSTVYRTLNGE